MSSPLQLWSLTTGAKLKSFSNTSTCSTTWAIPGHGLATSSDALVTRGFLLLVAMPLLLVVTHLATWAIPGHGLAGRRMSWINGERRHSVHARGHYSEVWKGLLLCPKTLTHCWSGSNWRAGKDETFNSSMIHCIQLPLTREGNITASGQTILTFTKLLETAKVTDLNATRLGVVLRMCPNSTQACLNQFDYIQPAMHDLCDQFVRHCPVLQRW